jgi:secreted PhoX family phosphatase
MFGVEGSTMSDGNPTPKAHDGMAAFALPNGNVRLIRNHEDRDTAVNSRVKGNPATAYDARGGGSTTSLEVKPDGDRDLVKDFISLNGTIVNGAGGPTPQGSWITCEETTAGETQGFAKDHGYNFEVPASAEDEVKAVPLKAMGRFVHEAIAVDPGTGIYYETEDRGTSGFYRFIPTSTGNLAAGSRWEAADAGAQGQPGQLRHAHWPASRQAAARAVGGHR